MPNHPLGAVLSRLRTVLEPAEAETTDRELLKRFVARREEAAFGELVRRHGPMVFGVCRRVLGDAHAAEDAFQATFLVLVRRAAAVPWRESLGGWLHGTARRVALRVRARAGRGFDAGRAPLKSAALDPAEEAAARELRRVLDQELQGLPAKYRAPLVLCDMEGKTHEQAARELGWPKGSIAKRLNGARERLRARLVRRGVAPAAGALMVFTASEGTAAPSAALCAAALLAMHGGASTTATALAKGVIQAMWFTKIMTAAVLTTMLAVTATAAGFGVYRAWEAHAAAPAPPATPALPPAEDKDVLPVDKAVVYHVGPVQGVQTDALPDGAVIAKDLPESVDDNVQLYLAAFAESKKQKLVAPVGPRLGVLAVGPVLNSGDEAVAVSLKRRGEKLDLEMAYTSGEAEGKVYKRNVPWRPLVQVPCDLGAGSYRLTVTWQARKTLPAGDAWAVKTTVSTCDFTVTGDDGRRESKAVSVKGVEFRVYAQKECPAPAANGSQPVELGLRVTNTTDKPLLFKFRDTVWLSLKTADGTELKLYGAPDKSRPYPAYPPVTVAAGQSIDVPRPGSLEWQADGKSLSLGGTDPSYFFWRFDGLHPGKYRLSVRYENGDGGKDQAQPYWVGKATTEEVEFTILDAANPSKSVRVDGLEFTAIAPARVTAPAPGGKADVDLGLRIVNLSNSKPITVCTFDVIQPRLVTSDGKELQPEIRGRKDTPKVTPPVTLSAGESWTWRPEASLSWTNDRAALVLSGPDGLGVGGAWSFTRLHPGKYQLILEYSSSTTKYIDIPVWVGKAVTEPVDFEITAP